MALTPQELEQARTLRLQGKSTDEVFNYIAGKRVNAPSRLSTVRKEPLSQGSTGGNIISDIPQDVFTGVKQLAEGYQDRFSRLKESGSALVNGEQGVGETGVQFAANIAGGLLGDTSYQLLRTGASFATSPEQETKIANKFGETVQAVGDKTGITNWYEGLEDRTKRNVSAALDIVDVLPAGVLGKFKSLFKGVPDIDVTPKIQEVLTKAETGDISDATRVANASLDETTRAAEVDKLATAYQDSLVGDRVKVNRLLQEQAQDMSRGDTVVTQDDLVRNLANEGVIPDIRGKLADFTTEIRNLDARQNKLFEAYQPVLNASKATASIDDFSSYAARSMADSRNLRFELGKAEAQLDTIVDNLRRSFGLDETGKLSAKQIDDISREANARSKAYREGGDTFQADVYSELGRSARKWLNENIPDEAFRKVNDEWLRLEQIKRTAEAMQNQQIDVGVLGRALGSYVTTLTGVTLAAGVSNPFVAVGAGILTKMGGDAIADALRSTRFSPEIRAKLQERLTTDKALIEKLKETATTQDNKNLYDQLSRMLPAPKEGALRSEVGSGAPVIAGGKTPDGVVQPGITERSVEGAVKQPGGVATPTLTEEALKKLAAAGVDADAVQKAIASGIGAYLLLAYLGEDGTMAPAGMAILSAVPKPVRKTLLNETKALAKKTGKAVNESDLDRIFRRQDEEMWKKMGMETSGDGTIKKLEGEIPAKTNATDALNTKKAPKDLMALHNTSNIETILGSGELPAPSIAITRKNIKFNDFGEVTLVGNPKLIDPTNTKVRSFGGDVYTVRTPLPEYATKPKAEILKIIEGTKIGTDSSNMHRIAYDSTKGSFIERYSDIPNIKKIADEIYGEPFISLKNKKPTGDLGELMSEPGFAKAFRESRDFDDFWTTVTNEYDLYDTLEELASKMKLEDMYDLEPIFAKQYGKKVPYTSENIVKSMEHRIQRNSDQIRGTESGWGTNAGPHIYGFKEFKSLDEIRANKGNLVQKEKALKLSDKREEALNKLVNKNWETLNKKPVFSDMNANFEEIVRGSKYSDVAFIKKQFGITDDTLAKQLGEKIKDTFANVPTQYFETKVLRSVKLNEFDGAVVPDGTPAETIKRLEDAGLKVVKYDGTVQDRMKKIAKFTGAAFGIMVVVNSNK